MSFKHNNTDFLFLNKTLNETYENFSVVHLLLLLLKIKFKSIIENYFHLKYQI